VNAVFGQRNADGVTHSIGQQRSYPDGAFDSGVFAFTDGHVQRPAGPGLGIEVDEDAVRAAAAEPHRWRSPVLRHDDGSFAEW